MGRLPLARQKRLSLTRNYTEIYTGTHADDEGEPPEESKMWVPPERH